jgi:hypothetical protein
MAIEFNWGQQGIAQNVTSVSLGVGGSGINPNDLLIACIVPQDKNASGAPGVVVAPPGWTVLDNTQIGLNTTYTDTSAIFYKVATGNETASDLTFSWSNGANCSWTLTDYSGVDTTNPIVNPIPDMGQTNTGWSGDTTAPSVVGNAGDTLVNIWITKGGLNPYTPKDQLESVNADVATSGPGPSDSEIPEIMVADKTLLSSGPTGSEVMTGTGGSTIDQRGFSIVLNAALCFMPGTMIRTPGGEVAVETLAHGDCVMTTDGRAEKVSWIGRQTVSLQFADPLRVLPIRIAANALGDNVPSRDLLVSPDHAILVEDVLIQAGALINGTSIVRETKVPQTFTYYHVELEDHSLIFAENVPAETFVDNVDRLAFDNWAEHEALYPEGHQISEMPYPRAKAFRQVPKAIRARLAERAECLGGAELLRIA